MKVYWTLALMALLVLGGAAVWMGGLNQDEGWYLYAANLVAEGKMPYRDFFYTQGPMLPIVYSAFAGVWKTCGLLGARVFTLALGLAGLAFAMALASRRAAVGEKGKVALLTLLLLGANLYHLYYVAIPKTYALAGLFVLLGFFVLSFVESACGRKALVWAAAAGASFAFAAGTRISLGAILAVVGVSLLLRAVRGGGWLPLVGFCVGGFGGLALVYGPFLLDAGARGGLMAAQVYHAARGGFDPVWTVGSFSRLVRWYLPVFIVLGLGVARLCLRTARVRAFDWTVLAAFVAVFAVQMLAPFPYEDYQVPVMGLLAVFAVTVFSTPPPQPSPSTSTSNLNLLLVLGLSFATSFGSPLLEQWSTNGQDRFWSRKKASYELAQLRDVARRIETLDPGGKELLTQDLYLAIETNRRVPSGFEMGPFSFWGDAAPAGSERRPVLTDASLRKLLAAAPCSVAALSGYSFAITAPRCDETPMARQMDYFHLLKKNYALAFTEEAFGQNATTLLVLKRK